MTYLPNGFAITIDKIQRDIYGLSKPDAVSAFVLIMISYRHHGGLRNDDEYVFAALLRFLLRNGPQSARNYKGFSRQTGAISNGMRLLRERLPKPSV
jgi:hypothetical protein